MSTPTNPYADQYITQMSDIFLAELKKIENLEESVGRREFELLVNKYDKQFIDKFMSHQNQMGAPGISDLSQGTPGVSH